MAPGDEFAEQEGARVQTVAALGEIGNPEDCDAPFVAAFTDSARSPQFVRT